MAFTLKLKDGSVRIVAKGKRDKSKSQAAKARRYAASQKGKTNLPENMCPRGPAGRR